MDVHASVFGELPMLYGKLAADDPSHNSPDAPAVAVLTFGLYTTNRFTTHSEMALRCLTPRMIVPLLIPWNIALTCYDVSGDTSGTYSETVIPSRCILQSQACASLVVRSRLSILARLR